MGYQDASAWSHGFGTPKSNMTAKYQDGAVGSHGLGRPDWTYIRIIRSGLQDLTGWEHQTERAHEVSERFCRISRAGNTRSYMLTRFKDGDRILRVRNIRSNMPRQYQDEAAGSHMFGTPDRTCLQGIRTGLRDHRILEQQIQHAFSVKCAQFHRF